VCTTIASPTNMASGGRLSARSSIDSWIAATCATDSRVSALENPDCRNEMLLAFSCHGGYFCPSCHAKRVAAFADWLAAADPTAQSISVTLGNSLHGSAQDSLDTPYRKACRRTWAQLIEKVYLVSPLVCPKCRCTMNIISFIKDPAVVCKILKHLGIWKIKVRPPPFGLCLSVGGAYPLHTPFFTPSAKTSS